MGTCNQGLGRARRIGVEPTPPLRMCMLSRFARVARSALCSSARACSLALALVLVFAASASRADDDLLPFRVEAGAINEALGGLSGEAARGRALVFSRTANCVLCHQVPGGDSQAMGDLGPPLDQVGARLNAGQLRLRVVDSSRINPQSIMPAYYRVEGRVRVAAAFAGHPVLDAQGIEDVVRYLETLR